MRQVTVAATQFACSWDRAANIAKAEAMIRAAHAQGAQIILIQELFETPYFCQDQKPEYFELAAPADGNPLLARMCELARELSVVLPLSFFEKANNAHYNSLATIDADGSILGIYRKSHIPDGPGYQEKFYFTPGDSGFQVYQTRYARIGTGICWDQWFPEAARVMALQGAEILFYPTAIGSEPQDASLDSRDHWQRVMQGHAGANLVPLVASNRIGTETFETGSITFYGSSFITGPKGEKIAEAERTGEALLTATFDLDAVARTRNGWGVFRDRRPALYAPIMGADGRNPLI
ncbi:N-carbamoylputrescine amidase [Niveispirillum sp. SYP-B3756]|uniref:N-carbamoylputrescine amidase n=1 Tax=Niveispirillum sp. SYP-B3756 TaxID=2662178 RepID=UPI001290CCA6|nr:N-carbamoylputrescine amidase [Niveispirillum sp. SYP-B3756]MQP64020.1 N-carbamoylputrescine amidase [Niveispirillum sp. SYP-B3756]